MPTKTPTAKAPMPPHKHPKKTLASPALAAPKKNAAITAEANKAQKASVMSAFATKSFCFLIFDGPSLLH